ncbi:response regulator [Pyxidicoccus fallax]|uniref:Response regulator n=1 Tax=Pyxidicoccus fallax TaxID=394095 RepID=A0A848LYM5_9BACT|nr:response regulator [Pyxidicoccus fallax]NMO22731.1 response regulator [Pyxidicoccus fallax]NPC84911.1 response regulator [Pyxidicoccus fallax]
MARILIVDDEVHVLGALRRLLRREGFSVEVALSGEEALDKLRTFEADLIISDFRMRGMNGVQLLGQVMNAMPRTVRVLLSGHADLRTGNDPQSGEGVVSRFFSKPWDNEDLVSEVRSLLETHAPSPGSA